MSIIKFYNSKKQDTAGCWSLVTAVEVTNCAHHHALRVGTHAMPVFRRYRRSVGIVNRGSGGCGDVPSRLVLFFWHIFEGCGLSRRSCGASQGGREKRRVNAVLRCRLWLTLRSGPVLVFESNLEQGRHRFPANTRVWVRPPWIANGTPEQRLGCWKPLTAGQRG